MPAVSFTHVCATEVVWVHLVRGMEEDVVYFAFFPPLSNGPLDCHILAVYLGAGVRGC